MTAYNETFYISAANPKTNLPTNITWKFDYYPPTANKSYPIEMMREDKIIIWLVPIQSIMIPPKKGRKIFGNE